MPKNLLIGLFFFFFSATSKTQFISLKPKIPPSPEVTYTKPGNYVKCLKGISQVKLKNYFVPLLRAISSYLYFVF